MLWNGYTVKRPLHIWKHDVARPKEEQTCVILGIEATVDEAMACAKRMAKHYKQTVFVGQRPNFAQNISKEWTIKP